MHTKSHHIVEALPVHPATVSRVPPRQRGHATLRAGSQRHVETGQAGRESHSQRGHMEKPAPRKSRPRAVLHRIFRFSAHF